MSFFLVFGDFFHLFSFFLVIFKLFFDRNYCLISIEMQMIKTFSFLLRFLDLFLFRISYYNTTMKIIIILLNIIIILLIIKNPNKNKINKKIFIFIIKICFFFSLIFPFGRNWWFDYVYSFSLWLESFSILPQIFLIEKEKIDIFIFFYFFIIFFYRIFYFFNWFFNYFYQANFYLIKFLTIGNQIIIILIFFFKQIKQIKNKNKIKIK